ncbi:uncharacterized protein LOC135109597 isoform X1 [Scylla paramamosain]|uniref:uncharacterized protein LOC135109597 isoform X1 n=2 Tax=Scylla paramamosain TaxID=85552 RepID=UPI003082AEEB
MDGYHKKVTVYWNITDKSTLFSPTQHVMTVLELPEDPDYSLKKSIDASVNEVVNVAKLLLTATDEVRSTGASVNGVVNVAELLLTATDEVRKLILNECDMVLQCKVCKNLFSSVDNSLMHKRIYCQEEFADRTLLHRATPASQHPRLFLYTSVPITAP